MKANLKCLSSLLFISSFVLCACEPGQLFVPTVAPTSTNIPTQIPTSTSTAISTPPPTLPPTPTITPTAIPAMGTPISNEYWEVTVVDAITHGELTGESGIERPENGHIFVDIGVKIKNLDPEENNLLNLRAKRAILFEIFDGSGKPIELYRYGVAVQETNPLYIPIKWTPDEKRVNQVFYDFRFISIVADFNLQEYTTMSIRLILNAEKEIINAPLILQFQDVPLIQFFVKK